MSVRFRVRGEQLALELVCACSATSQQLLVLMSKNSSVFHIFNTVSRFYLDCAEVSFKRFVPCCQAIVITRQITPLRAFPPRLFSTKTQRAVVAHRNKTINPIHRRQRAQRAAAAAAAAALILRPPSPDCHAAPQRPTQRSHARCGCWTHCNCYFRRSLLSE